MKKYQSLYLAGIISEETFYQIQELDNNGQLTEGTLRNIVGAGAMALGSLFGQGGVQAQTPATQPAAVAKFDTAQFADSDSYSDPVTYIKDAMRTLRSGPHIYKYGRGENIKGGTMEIENIKPVGQTQDGKYIVTVTGKARGSQGALVNKTLSAMEDLMGKHKGISLNYKANDGKYLVQVPDDVISPGPDLYPFSVTITIGK